MVIITPADLLAFFNDEEARVQDEVVRLQALLSERAPLSARPKHMQCGSFCFPLADEVDVAFMEKVGERFRLAGWDAKVVSEHDMGGQRKEFRLRHESLSGLPQASARQRMRGM